MDENATSGVWEKHKGIVHWFPFGVLAENVKTDATHRFLTDEEKKNITDEGGGTVRFEAEPAQRKLLESGSRPGRLFAWINRWLRDLKTVAFTGRYPDLSDRPQLGTAAAKGVSNSTGVTQDGYVADARAVKAVNDKFGGMSFAREGGDIYAVYTEGADTVRKKLGNAGVGISIVDIMAPIKIRNGEINNGSGPEPSWWGMVSQYDLKILDGYQDFVFGVDGNMLVVVQSVKVNQDLEYPVTVLPTRQGNFNGSFDMNNYLSNQRQSYIDNYLPHYDDEVVMVTEATALLKRPKEQLNNFALYNPETGYLYVVTTSTSHASYISLWKK